LKKNTLFLTLRTFSATGGIEKVCKVVGKTLYEQSIVSATHTKVFSMYDKQTDVDENIYFPSEMFRGFGQNKFLFILSSVIKGRKADVVILSHINLLLAGWLIKLISPSTKLFLFAHGIEIWGRLRSYQKWMLKSCDLIIPVSQFTADKITDQQDFLKHKVGILNNCLDPFLQQGKEYINDNTLRVKYNFASDDIVLMTLTRLSSKERYKGYDRVIQAIAVLKEKYPTIKYLLAGSYDNHEKQYLDKLITDCGVSDKVLFTGFIPEEELVSHFVMADLYVMPSVKEGFGIVFIEAMFYGLPVIAGNLDGSVDALANGRLGLLINGKVRFIWKGSQR